MQDHEFKQLMELAKGLAPDQKFKLCREMEVVPLACKFHGEQRFPEPPGPLRKLMNDVALTCELVKDTYDGILNNRFKLANPALAELLDMDMMSEEGGIVSRTCKELQDYRQAVFDVRSGAKTTFAKRREETWKNNRKNSGVKVDKPQAAPTQKAKSKDKGKTPTVKPETVEEVKHKAVAPVAEKVEPKTEPKDDSAQKKKLVAAIKKMTGEEVDDSLALSTLKKKYLEAKKGAKKEAKAA